MLLDHPEREGRREREREKEVKQGEDGKEKAVDKEAANGSTTTAASIELLLL